MLLVAEFVVFRLRIFALCCDEIVGFCFSVVWVDCSDLLVSVLIVCFNDAFTVLFVVCGLDVCVI